MTQIKAGRYA